MQSQSYIHENHAIGDTGLEIGYLFELPTMSRSFTHLETKLIHTFICYCKLAGEYLQFKGKTRQFQTPKISTSSGIVNQ